MIMKGSKRKNKQYLKVLQLIYRFRIGVIPQWAVFLLYNKNHRKNTKILRWLKDNNYIHRPKHLSITWKGRKLLSKCNMLN